MPHQKKRGSRSSPVPDVVVIIIENLAARSVIDATMR